jgi:hypothetical protein
MLDTGEFLDDFIPICSLEVNAFFGYARFSMLDMVT